MSREPLAWVCMQCLMIWPVALPRWGYLLFQIKPVLEYPSIWLISLAKPKSAVVDWLAPSNGAGVKQSVAKQQQEILGIKKTASSKENNMTDRHCLPRVRRRMNHILCLPIVQNLKRTYHRMSRYYRNVCYHFAQAKTPFLTFI